MDGKSPSRNARGEGRGRERRRPKLPRARYGRPGLAQRDRHCAPAAASMGPVHRRSEVGVGPARRAGEGGGRLAMISSRRAMGTEMECVPILGCWGVGHSHRLSTIQAGSARQPTWTRQDQKGVLYLCTQSTVDMSVCMYRTVLKRTSQSQKQKRGTVRTRKSNRESERSSAARPRTQTTGRTYLNRTPPRYRQWQASRPPFAHCPHLRRPNSFFFLTLVTTSGTPAADTGDGASPP